jgi:cell volume regulation protein A
MSAAEDHGPRTRPQLETDWMETVTALLAIGLIIFIGFFGNLIFTRCRIPEVLILVGVGMILGPDILGDRFGLIDTSTLEDLDEFRDIFLTVALIIILFDGGLNLDIRAVIESMRASLFMAVGAFSLTVVGTSAALYFIMDVDVLLSVLLGCIVGGTSGAIVIPIVSKMRISPRTKAMLSIESIVTDVLVIVAALTLLSVIEIRELDMVLLARTLLSKFVVGGLIGAAVGVAWLFVLQRLQNQPLSYMITIGALFLVAGAVELAPLSSSGAVAALAFGLALGNRQFVKRHLTSVKLKFSTDAQISWFHSEISFFVRTFFFVYLGLFFRFDTFTRIHLVLGLLVISMIVLARWIMSVVVWKLVDMDTHDAMAVFANMPRGLAAAVLATLPGVALVGLATWDADLNLMFVNTTLVVILGTTILTTVLNFATEKSKDRSIRHKMREDLRSVNGG